MKFSEWLLIREGGKGSGAKPNIIHPRGMFKPAKPQIKLIKRTV
jgi:hypothetical protein